jgi:hypothetical protein
MTHVPSTSKRSTGFPALPRFLARPQLLTRSAPLPWEGHPSVRLLTVCTSSTIPALGERLMHAHHMSSDSTPSTGRHGWWRLPWGVAIVATLGLALATAHPAQAKTFHCNAGDVVVLHK